MDIDYDIYDKHITADDPLQIIIRGHLYVEYNLIRLIEESIPHPQAINLTRFSFPLKIDLAIALGLLSPEEQPAYIALNRFRNKLAHNLEMEITKDDESDFFNTLNSTQRHVVSTHKLKPNDFPWIFRKCITVLLLTLEVSRENLVKNKEEMNRLHRKVNRILSKRREKV